MDIVKTENYYRTLNGDRLCSCDYCRNYYKEIKKTYLELSDYLAESIYNGKSPLAMSQ